MRWTSLAACCLFVSLSVIAGGCSGGSQPAAPENQQKVEEAKNKAMEEAKARMEQEMQLRRSGGGPGTPPR